MSLLSRDDWDDPDCECPSSGGWLPVILAPAIAAIVTGLFSMARDKGQRVAHERDVNAAIAVAKQERRAAVEAARQARKSALEVAREETRRVKMISEMDDGSDGSDDSHPG